MTLRQERLEERRQEFLPELRKAREIFEKAEAERRDMTGDEQKSCWRDHQKAAISRHISNSAARRAVRGRRNRAALKLSQ